MKLLQDFLDNIFNLLIVLVLVTATVLLVGGQTLGIFRNKSTISATQATIIKQQTVEVVAFQSPLPTPSPSPALSLKIISVDTVKNGPYQNIVWSPDGKKALISKQYTQYLLARNKNISIESLSPEVIPGTTTGLSDLWLLDLTTGEERQLLKQVGRYTWSPDSARVAYLTPTEAEGITGSLYVFDIAVNKTSHVTSIDFLGSDYVPQWLPTGEIVYVRDGQLWSIQPDGKGGKILPGLKFFNRLAAEEGKTAYLTDPNAPVGYHFSPDGKRIAYKTRNKNERAISSYLWLADADGSNAKLITEQAEGSYYEWSPDSQWLVFNTFRDANDPTMDERDSGLQGLWVVRSDGSDTHSLYRTDNWRWILSPTWSPDSKMVIFIQTGQFTGDGNNARNLWVANVTKEETSLLLDSNDGKTVIYRVWWSSDGSYLFTFSDVPGDNGPSGHYGGVPGYHFESYRFTLATE